MTNDIEDRLRTTLVAEAERHPVTPDLEALRAGRDGSDRAVVDLHLSPRRNRARILAAAVVLAVLALAAAGVVRSGGDGGGEPVASGAGASGYYLPGPGWEITGVVVPPRLDRGTVREIHFGGELGDDGPQVRAIVFRAATIGPEVTGRWEAGGALPVDRNDAQPPVWLEEDEGLGGDGTPTVSRILLVPADGEVLVLSGDDVDLDVLLATADRWVETDGREIALAPGLGAHRWFDTTYTDPVAIDVSGLTSSTSPPVAAAEVPLVLVTAEGPGGEVASYTLAGPDTAGRPTGVGDADGGASRGLERAARRRLLDGVRDDGEVWATPGVSGITSLVGLLPAADVTVAIGSPDGPPSVGTDEAGLRDLMAGLRPVDGETWAAAVAGLAVGVRDWPARLAEVEPTGEREGEGRTETTFAASAETITDTTESTETTETTTPTETTEATETTVGGEAAHPVTESLVALATDGAMVPPVPLAPEVTVGFVGSTDADVVLTGEDRTDPDRWVLDLAGRWGRDGPVSALDRVASGLVVARQPGAAEPSCTADVPAAGNDVVTVVPETIESCIDWFGVVVRLDAEGRIAEVRIRLWEP